MTGASKLAVEDAQPLQDEANIVSSSSAASMLLEKANAGTMRASVCGSKEWWPSYEQIDKYELNVGLFWQLQRIYFAYETNEKGWKRIKPESEAKIKDMCIIPEGDEMYEQLLKAIVNWDVYFRLYVMNTCSDPEEKLRCALALRTWCTYGWKFLSQGLRDRVHADLPADMLPAVAGLASE